MKTMVEKCDGKVERSAKTRNERKKKIAEKKLRRAANCSL
jgi:hypothetical protein